MVMVLQAVHNDKSGGILVSRTLVPKIIWGKRALFTSTYNTISKPDVTRASPCDNRWLNGHTFIGNKKQKPGWQHFWHVLFENELEYYVLYYLVISNTHE